MPVLDHDRARDFAESLRRAGRRIVLAHGVYDLLHPGHLGYLRAARLEGDALIVAVKSDRAVCAASGPARPVTPEAERAEILAALESVDAVVIFDAAAPDAIVELIQPDILVVSDAEPAAEAGAQDQNQPVRWRVVSIPIQPGWSTASIVDSIQRRSAP